MKEKISREGLPAELLAQLSKRNSWTFYALDVVREMGAASKDDIIVGIYRKSGIIATRGAVHTWCWRKCSAGELKMSAPGTFVICS